MEDPNCTRQYYSNIPKIGFKYGTEDYYSASCQKFSVGETVIWSPIPTEGVLKGEIEFIGGKYPGGNLGLSSLIAVVAFSQPTCHLPGHIANPPCYRNVINIEKLKKVMSASRQLPNGSVAENGTSKTPVPTEIYGNCIGKNKFDPKPHSDYRAGDLLFVITAERGIMGKIIVTGDVGLDGGTIGCVGVHWEDTLEVFAPLLTIRHNENNKDGKCKDCLGGTLAFIPVEYIGNKDFVGFEIGKGVNSDLKLGMKRLFNKGRNIKCWLFVGNCVPNAYGYTDVPVSNCKIGSKVTARKENKFAQGVVIKTCTINDTAGIGDDTYVCIRFNTALEVLNLSKDIILHHEEPVTSTNVCDECKGNTNVYIPANCLLSRSGTAADSDGVIFTVLN